MGLQEFDDLAEEYRRDVARIKAAIKAQVRGLPDNPRIRRLGRNCFVMSSRDLGSCWSPEYHDFKRQYEAIVGEIDVRKPEDVAGMIAQIIRDGQIKLSGANPVRRAWGTSPFRFHPDVIQYLRGL